MSRGAKIAGQVLQNNSRLRRYLSVFRKETKVAGKNVLFLYAETDMLFFLLFTLEKLQTAMNFRGFDSQTVARFIPDDSLSILVQSQ